MLIDFADIANDPDLGDEITIIRSDGSFGAGGWIPGQPSNIQACGVIGIADDEALAQVPEGDRVTGSLQLVTATPIFPTLANKSGTSDQILWLNNTYRVQASQPWKHAGFWSAILVRMSGE